jgi:hypothetical protein
VDFAPLLEGRLPQGLIENLGQIHTGVNDAGPPLSASGFPGALAARGGVLLRLGMNRSPTGFLALTEGILSLLGRIRIEVPQAKHRSTTTLRRYDAYLYFG